MALFNFKKTPKIPTPYKEVSELPDGRVSKPQLDSSFLDLKKSLAFVKPQFQYEYIPVIRKLLSVNSSVSLAASSLVELSNTGYEVEFDPGVSEADKLKMREHLELVTPSWGFGVSGVSGIINKLFYQLLIGGAMSTEWVIKNNLSGIKYPAFINPENVRVAWDSEQQVYRFYQYKGSTWYGLNLDVKDVPNDYIALNPLTYQYHALIGDTDNPIGIPPFLSALDDVQAQLKMLKNIGFVTDQLGIMGFLEVLLAKPSQREGEGDSAYNKRLTDLLTKAKSNISSGVKDGVVAGFESDHSFDFHATTKDTGGVAEIFDINQRTVANGLLTSPQFLGGSMGGTETMVTVVFTKMLSQLSNMQRNAGAIIARGFFIELILAGFNPKRVYIKFKPSTITDELKIQQALEIKQRIARIKYADGIIGQDQHARELGHDKADLPEPRVEIDPVKIAEKVQSQKKDQNNENKSDRNQRDKEKPQPKRKDNK